MKKILLSGMFALSLALASGQEAKAWVNFKFGIGANVSLQSGGNSLLWGAFKNGQVPGPEAYGFPGGGHPGYGHGPAYAPGHGHGQDFPFMGSAMPAPSAPAASAPATVPAGAPAQQTYWQGGNPYYTTGYSPYTYTPNYYYPTSYYPSNSFYAPTYWYGR